MFICAFLLLYKVVFAQCPFFVRFCSFLYATIFLLFEKLYSFSSAFLYVHIRTYSNQIVTYWTKVFEKKFLQRGCSPILKYRSGHLYTKFLNKILMKKQTADSECGLMKMRA